MSRSSIRNWKFSVDRDSLSVACCTKSDICAKQIFRRTFRDHAALAERRVAC
jgi:hypothetical protein